MQMVGVAVEAGMSCPMRCRWARLSSQRLCLVTNQGGVQAEDTMTVGTDITPCSHKFEYAFSMLPYVTDAELSARLTAAKKTPGRVWLGEVSAVVLQNALADLNAAYRNYFASLNGKRKGPKVQLPRFRSRKDTRQAIRFTRNARFKVLPNRKLRLPKIGDVPVRWSRPLPSAPSSVTVIRDSAGRYFASFVVEAGPWTLPDTGHVVGIDLGLHHFAVLSDGRKITAPQFLRRAEKNLKRRQRDLSRK